ncbi:type IIL restriction-modification enzyme MmeI [Limosilactobacillus fermentum]|uniref:type IIL restriction-modification enzyme MmeI n=1 Tax=Limosilactobacillus fermentum TaxID=1613 RepID=UPI001F291685|nr:hypothetical protein [Limosilactobacillus fermentum]UJP16379.1 hypothetical protein L1970_03740 [Limosilactobacillus fermentum]
MATRQQNAREFVKTWSSSNKGREDADRQTFWNDLLQRVYGINDYYNYITYEKDVPFIDIGADLFCPNSVRINFTIYLSQSTVINTKLL